jgi:hypothetical protein
MPGCEMEGETRNDALPERDECVPSHFFIFEQ